MEGCFCSDFWQYTPDGAVGVNELNTENNFSLDVSPNPTTSLIHCNFSESGLIPILSIKNLLGEQVLEQSIAPNLTEAEFDFTHLPAGIYLLEAETEKGIIVQKVVKE